GVAAPPGGGGGGMAPGGGGGGAPRHEAGDPAFPGDGPLEETFVLVGPEGGFSAAEVCLAATHGFTPYRFRTPVLKTPTAVAVVGALGLLGDQLRAES
ncbi:MAG: RsmE family RNA methyltransferase, partial [Planctomycetes bacterium]|nr:RsmE family RNA methyltransferase [Planctomycetota bacterium]